jgi:hypothetical protein
VAQRSTHVLSLRLTKDRKGTLVPGVPDGPLKDAGPCPKGATGTIIRFWPDLSLFSDEHGVPFSKPQWSTEDDRRAVPPQELRPSRSRVRAA